MRFAPTFFYFPMKTSFSSEYPNFEVLYFTFLALVLLQFLFIHKKMIAFDMVPTNLQASLIWSTCFHYGKRFYLWFFSVFYGLLLRKDNKMMLCHFYLLLSQKLDRGSIYVVEVSSQNIKFYPFAAVEG